MRLAVAMPACCVVPGQLRTGYALEALALHGGDLRFDVFLRDEGDLPVIADRWTRLAIDLLGKRGHSLTYVRRNERHGVAAARRDLLEHIPTSYDPILLLDDDMVVSPRAVDALLEATRVVDHFGFVQGTKLELDPLHAYANDINVLNGSRTGEPVRVYFGDASFLLVRREALACVQWNLVACFAEENMAGEDVAFSLMISDRYPCYGVPRSIAYHMATERPRWKWEPSSDALQIELLRGVVSADTLKRALPHMARYVDQIPPAHGRRED